MKGLRYAAAAAILACGTSAALAAEHLSASDVRQNLYDTCVIDEHEALAVGDLGRIFLTVDAAKTWDLLGAGTKRPFVSIACPDPTHIWVAGQAGDVAHSSDGAKTWQMQTSGTNRQLLQIAFANAQRGLAVGDFGTIVRTDDGGKTWTKIALPEHIKLPPDVAEVVDPGDVVLYSVTFANPDSAWIVGEFGVILTSSDGGLTWSGQDSPVESSLFGVPFTDQQHGWAVGLESTLLVTVDGGISWKKQEVQTPNGFALALYDVQVRGNYGWAVGDNGFLLNSKDAGATWQLVHVPVQMGSTWFRSVSLLPDGRGLVVGAKGLVLSTDRDQFTTMKERF